MKEAREVVWENIEKTRKPHYNLTLVLLISAEPVRLGISQLSLLNGAAAEDHQENSTRQIEFILLLRIIYFSALESLCALP